MEPKELIQEIDYTISQKDFYHVMVYQDALEKIVVSNVDDLEDLHILNRYYNYILTQIETMQVILQGVIPLQQPIYSKNGLVIVITDNYFHNNSDDQSYESQINQKLIHVVDDVNKAIIYCTLWINKHEDATFFHLGHNLDVGDIDKPNVENVIRALKTKRKILQLKLHTIQKEIQFLESDANQEVSNEQETLLSIVALQLIKGGELSA